MWKDVPQESQRQARSHILSTVGEFQDLAMDMVVADTGSINEFWVEELEKLHKEIRNINAFVHRTD